MLNLDLTKLEEELVNHGFEEDRKFYYTELVDISKELSERLRGGLIEYFSIIPSDEQEYILYVRR